MPQDILDRLSDARRYDNLSVKHDALVCDAHAEIEKLRAAQFRWIPFRPLPQNSEMDWRYLATDGENFVVDFGFNLRKHIGTTHFTPIPPLPEKSQEEKDRELWNQYSIKHDFTGFPANQDMIAAFLAGLKAAREEKK